VSDIVKESGDANGSLILLGDPIGGSQAGNDPSGEMESSQRMRKARMLGSLISKMREPELTDPAQPLKFRSIDQSDK
jgi:hypothetical protein